MNPYTKKIIEKQAEDPLPSGGGMNAVPNAIELEQNRYLVRDL